MVLVDKWSGPWWTPPQGGVYVEVEVIGRDSIRVTRAARDATNDGVRGVPSLLTAGPGSSDLLLRRSQVRGQLVAFLSQPAD